MAELRIDRSVDTADDEHDPEGVTLSTEWARLAGLRAGGRPRPRRDRRGAGAMGCRHLRHLHRLRSQHPDRPASGAPRRHPLRRVRREGGRVSVFGLRHPARAGFATVRDEQPCPCGSGERFDGCCAPLLRGARGSVGGAPDALAVHGVRRGRRPVPRRRRGIRGRVRRSSSSRPSLRWTGLEIVDVVAGGEGDTRGVVEFRAHWREGGETRRARGAEPVRPAERSLVVPRRHRSRERLDPTARSRRGADSVEP